MSALSVVNPAVVRHAPAEQQERALEVQLDRARTALALALEASDVHMVAQIKSGTAVMEKLSKELRLSKECQLDAAEMVRRSEYALGKAIRRGQAEGLVETAHEARLRGVVVRDVRLGRKEENILDNFSKPKPTDFASDIELRGNKVTSAGIYNMSDDVDEVTFESALASARESGNVTRAEVVRSIKAIEGDSSPGFQRKKAPRKSRVNSNRVLESTAAALEGAAYSIQLIEPDQLDQESAETQLDSLTESIKALSKAVKKIKESIHE